MVNQSNGDDVEGKSPENPDPFDSLFAIPGSELSLTANIIVQDFTITTDSYILLCTNLYEALSAENPMFADKISESAFLYYAIMLLWQRLGQFLPPRSCKSSPFLNELSYFEPYLTGIPKSLEIYLKGIGNFEHPYLGQMRFRLPKLLVGEKFDLTTGTFGKVSADTHFLYEAFPAPGIAALRILADMSKTIAFISDPIWDLPENIRPDVRDHSTVDAETKSDPPKPMPTKNLLGWSPAQSLTDNQLELLQTLGIKGNVTQNDMSKFFDDSVKLLAAISAYFDGTKKVKKVQTQTSNSGSTYNHYTNSYYATEQNYSKSQTPVEQPIKTDDCFECLEGFTKVKRLPFTGSTIQGLTLKKASEPDEFDRSRMYCDGVVSVSSSFNANKNLVAGAVVAGYRMAKEPIIHNKHSWSCYDFNKYENVPQSWISTRNSIYTFQDVEGLNKPVWTSGTTDKRLTQYSFLKKHLMATEDNWNVYM